MSVEFKDYYKVLGVPRDADAGTIKKAFRKLAREHHPDVAKDQSASEARFKEINEAYEVLGDPEKRKRYDALGSDWNRQGGPSGEWGGFGGGDVEFEFGGTGFSDFFERFFGGGRHEAAWSQEGFTRRTGRRRGADVEGDLMVTLLEAIEGSVRTISLQRTDSRTGRSWVDEVKVRIPPGIGDRQKLRVAGHGGPGSGGAPAGDLFLRVKIAADPDFRVEGHDLYRELTLAPWEAVLGMTLELRLPGGRKVQLKVPPGTQSGDQLRLRGYGMPRKAGPGDLYVVITIGVPETVSGAERELWEKLRRESTFRPRD
jgi:curved DNA-binding protein